MRTYLSFGLFVLFSMCSLSAAAQDSSTGAPEYTIGISGDYDVAPTHPTCADSKERENCFAEAILAELQARTTHRPSENSLDSDLEITMGINPFGNIISITVGSLQDQELYQAVIKSLYALPKMLPATKGDAGAASTVEIIYPLSTVFPAE